MSGSNAKPRVAIVGAGLTGLLVAQGLKKNGIDATVFEREAHMDARTRDWTVLLHWALPIMTGLLPDALADRLPEALCNRFLDFNDEVESVPVYDGTTGQLLFQSATPGARRITRQRLRKLLAEGVDVRWGRALERLEFPSGASAGAGAPVRLIFAGGDSFDADYVLGADGTSSKLRGLLVGADAARPSLSGFMFAASYFCYGDAEKVKAVVARHPVAAIMMGTSSVAAVGTMYVDDPDDLSSWATFWVKIWKASEPNLRGQDAIDHVRATPRLQCEPFQSAIDWTPDGSACTVDEMRYWVPVPYDNHGGTVALAGDAAHPMLPYRGQGMQHAITDAKNYIDALLSVADHGDAATRTRVMTAYDSEMVERGAAAVKQSLKEAENSLNIDTVSNMLMATHGHGRMK